MQMVATNATYLAARAPATIQIRLDNSLGAILIGLIFASILFGIANVQSFIYYQTSSNDPKYLRWTVLCLWLMDAFHLALISHSLYRFLVTDFGSFLAITRSDWSLCSQVVVTAISDFIISLCYVYRVWIMSKKNRLLTYGALALNVVRFGFGLSFGIKIFEFESVLQITTINWLGFSTIGLAIASDLWSALCLCYYLARDRTGFNATDSKLNTLMLYIISTGLLTSVFWILCLVLMAAAPRTYYYEGVFFCISKLYFNGFLAMLNARNYMRSGSSGRSTDPGAYQLPQIVNIGRPSASNAISSFGTLPESSDKVAHAIWK